jgi:hypothetical protein
MKIYQVRHNNGDCPSDNADNHVAAYFSKRKAENRKTLENENHEKEVQRILNLPQDERAHMYAFNFDAYYYVTEIEVLDSINLKKEKP